MRMATHCVKRAWHPRASEIFGQSLEGELEAIRTLYDSD